MRRTDKQANKRKHQHCRGEQDKRRPVPSSVFGQIRYAYHILSDGASQAPRGDIFLKKAVPNKQESPV